MTRNITLSANEVTIERARERARQQQTSLNAAFRQWLEAYAGELTARETYEEVMQQLSHVRANRTFNRDEMNER